MPFRPATYGQGFARNAAQSAFPELWRGLAGLWPPSLGATGLTLYDWSDNKNDGTLTNMVAADDWVAGERGYALDYDGSNDSVNFGAPTSLQFAATDPFSIAFWAYWNSAAVGIDAAFAYATTTGRGYYIDFDAGTLATDGIFWDYFPNTGSPNFRRRITGNNAIQRDTWHHVVISQDASNNHTGMRIWIDGEQADVSGSNSGVDSIAYAGVSASIGARQLGSFFNGQIGDVSIYNRALSPNEIAGMYAGASPLILRRRVAVGPVFILAAYYYRTLMQGDRL